RPAPDHLGHPAQVSRRSDLRRRDPADVRRVPGLGSAGVRRGQRDDGRADVARAARAAARTDVAARDTVRHLRRLRAAWPRVRRYHPGGAASRPRDVVSVADLFAEIGDAARSVALAVLPLTVLFLIFQALFLNLPAREVARVLTGTLIASVGLFLFLLGVGIGFLPFGRAVGEAVGSLPAPWMLLPFGMLLGFVTTWGEPSVRILADQVEEASTGSIPRTLVVVTVSTGVAVAVGVGLLRIAHGIALPWIVVPGYLLMLAIIRFVDPDFIGI